MLSIVGYGLWVMGYVLGAGHLVWGVGCGVLGLWAKVMVMVEVVVGGLWQC